jgi:hypothetical protein
MWLVAEVNPIAEVQSKNPEPGCITLTNQHDRPMRPLSFQCSSRVKNVFVTRALYYDRDFAEEIIGGEID